MEEAREYQAEESLRSGEPDSQPGGERNSQPGDEEFYRTEYQKYLEKEKARKKKRNRMLLVLAAVLVLGAVAGWYVMDKNKLKRARDAGEGQLPYKTEAEIQTELNRRIAESALAISINAKPEFENGTAKARLCIENSPANHYAVNVIIRLSDSGEKVYESGLIDPNHYVEYGTLSRNLPAGTYKATATFTAYTLEGEKEKGNSQVEMELIVKN